MMNEHVTAWQRIVGVPADGDFGPITRRASMRVWGRAESLQRQLSALQAGASPGVSRETTAFDMVGMLLGLHEIPGPQHHPFIQWAFMLCGYGTDTSDETAWCSAMVQVPMFLLGRERSKSARARSWLMMGEAVSLETARPGFDVVILNRAGGPMDPQVIAAPGHVGLFHSLDGGQVIVRGGNQRNQISDAPYKAGDVLGVRRMRALGDLVNNRS